MENAEMSTQLFSLTGKVAMVTGGSQNFGLEIASGLAEAGAEVIITSRDESKAQKAACELAARTGATVHGMGMDLLSEESIVGLFEAVKSVPGRIDVLVNNAGGHSPMATGKLETEPLEGWRAYIDTNMTGTFLMIRECVKLMMPQKSGSIINIASIAAVLGRDRRLYPEGMRPQPVPYAAAKAGILGLTFDSAGYLAPWGIRVNAISPGGFERGQPQSFIHGYSDRTMLGRMGRDGADLKGAVLFLASDASSYVTAQNIFVDGGFCRFK
jgi:NAD(P)-dependent dehydrogenase (short-subunit alcohol dehydrogenase family)